MHELSIAMGIVEAAMDEARQRNVQVSAVHLRLGALSGVVKDDLCCKDTDPVATALSRRCSRRRSGNREWRCASGPQQGSSQADYNGNTVPPGSGDGAGRATGLGSAST